MAPHAGQHRRAPRGDDRRPARPVLRFGGAQWRQPDDFDLHKTTFPTVRYYLALEQELKAAGVRYEYVEAGNVEDFQGYKNAVNAVLNSMPVDGVDAVVSSDIGAALCVREAMRRHISIPRDLQIIAYDGTYLTDLAGMKMTAVAQNFDKIAQVAGRPISFVRSPRKGMPRQIRQAPRDASRTSRTC